MTNISTAGNSNPKERVPRSRLGALTGPGEQQERQGQQEKIPAGGRASTAGLHAISVTVGAFATGETVVRRQGVCGDAGTLVAGLTRRGAVIADDLIATGRAHGAALGHVPITGGGRGRVAGVRAGGRLADTRRGALVAHRAGTADPSAAVVAAGLAETLGHATTSATAGGSAIAATAASAAAAGVRVIFTAVSKLVQASSQLQGQELSH